MKTLRESLGLPVSWVARQAGVSKRTVEYWEAGRSAVPDDVASILESVDSLAEQSIGQLANSNHLLRYRSNDALWSALPEWRGMPTTAHAAMLGRARRAMAANGVAVIIQYAE